MSVVMQNLNTGQKSQALLFELKLKKEGMHLELANLYRGQQNYVGAVTELKLLLKKTPCLSYKVTLVDIYAESKSYEHALIHVDDLLSCKVVDSKVLYVITLLKIECLVQLSRLDEALIEIDNQMHTYFEDELLAWKAVVYMKLNNFEYALKFYEKSVKTNNRNEKSWVGIGSIHCIKGDYELGISCFKRALDINSENIAAAGLIKKFSNNCEEING